MNDPFFLVGLVVFVLVLVLGRWRSHTLVSFTPALERKMVRS